MTPLLNPSRVGGNQPQGWRCRAILALLLAAACAGGDGHLKRYFPGPGEPGEEVAEVERIPAALRVDSAGGWAPEDEPPAGGETLPPPWRLQGETLLVTAASGQRQARVEGVQPSGDQPRVAVSPDGRRLATGARRGRLRPGSTLVLVSLVDGHTSVAAEWDMPEAEGRLDLEELRFSPDGRRLACQLVDVHSGPEGGTREAGRRGVVLDLEAPAGGILDLGDGIRGPMRWSPRGDYLYYFRTSGGRPSGAATLRRAPFPAAASTAALPAPVEVGSPAAAPPSTGATAVAPPPSPRMSQQEMVERIVALSSGSPAEQIAAAQALGGSRRALAVGPLLQAMEAGDPVLCRAAADALGALLRPADPPALAATRAEECAQAAARWRRWWEQNPEALAP